MANIIWNAGQSEYGKVRTENDADAARAKLINLLETDWNTFGEDGDKIIISFDDEK